MTFAEWAARRSLSPVYAAQLTAARKSDGQELALYQATHGGQWDAAHNYRPFLVAPVRLRHRAQGLTGQSSLISYGSLGLAIPPGRTVDSNGLVFTDDLDGYTFEGRPIQCCAGGPGLAWASWWQVMNGLMGQPEWDDDSLQIPISGRTAELADKLIPPNEYSAADGVPESTVGRSKPLALGRLRNIEPLLIDEATYTYQFNDPAFGPVQAVDAVRVKGKVVTSGFTTNLTQGTIAFGSQPAGTVTLDVRGRVSGPLGGYVDHCAGLIEDVLRGLGGASAADIDAAAFAACAALRPWPLGIYLTRQVSIKQVIDALLTALLVIFRDTRDGRWSLRALEDTTGTPDHIITADRIKKGSFKHSPDGNSPAWKVTVAGARNWTTLSSLDDSLSADDKAWLQEQFTNRSASDASIQDLYPKAKELGPHETYLYDPDDAEALAALWLALFGRERGEDSFTTHLIGLPVELGDLVQVFQPRHGMAGGKLTRCWGVEENHQDRTIKLELWG